MGQILRSGLDVALLLIPIFDLAATVIFADLWWHSRSVGANRRSWLLLLLTQTFAAITAVYVWIGLSVALRVTGNGTLPHGFHDVTIFLILILGLIPVGFLFAFRNVTRARGRRRRMRE